MLDATQLAPLLWMGSKPRRGYHVAHAGFDVLCLCAAEYQPHLRDFPGLHCIIHAPLHDGELDSEAINIATSAAVDIHDYVIHGDRALITCGAGRNRSGLVAALALHLISRADLLDCVLHIKRHRIGSDGEEALTNPHFLAFLRAFRTAC
jgi:hypothetical protein